MAQRDGAFSRRRTNDPGPADEQDVPRRDRVRRRSEAVRKEAAHQA
ncbi:hypothetical protein CVCC1112_3808 [Paenarthrobacter nicotinovorans]|nr:hypothetical protein CVCC1112_3808 [Paenarthrobacter nicotinovorans]